MVRIRSKFPPEEQLESLAARVRPVMLDRDPVYLPKVLGALAYFLRGVPEHEQACRRLKQRWQEVDPRGGKLAGYRVEQGHTDGTGDISTASDSVLALAWLYGDVVHADTERRAAAGGISIEERYRSAAHAVARIAVLLLSALGFILHLRREGRLPLSDTVLKQAVVVISPDRDEVVRFWMAEVGTEMPAEGEPFGPGWGQVNLHSSPPEDPSASSDD